MMEKIQELKLKYIVKKRTCVGLDWDCIYTKIFRF